MYIVYPNNEKISVDPWLLCDILQGLKALCDMSRRIQHFSNPFLAFYCPFKVIKKHFAHFNHQIRSKSMAK